MLSFSCSNSVMFFNILYIYQTLKNLSLTGILHWVQWAPSQTSQINPKISNVMNKPWTAPYWTAPTLGNRNSPRIYRRNWNWNCSYKASRCCNLLAMVLHMLNQNFKESCCSESKLKRAPCMDTSRVVIIGHKWKQFSTMQRYHIRAQKLCFPFQW